MTIRARHSIISITNKTTKKEVMNMMLSINEMVEGLNKLGYVGMTLETVSKYNPKQLLLLEEFTRNETHRRKCADDILERMTQEFKETSK